MEFRSLVRSFVRWYPPLFFVLYYCTVLLYMCRRQERGPRAQKGSRATGTTRGTQLRAPQGREQRGTVLRTCIYILTYI